MFGTYRRLLVLYPRTFRERFAGEMLQAIRDRHAWEGRVPWPTVFGDLALSAVVLRFKEMTDVKTKVGVALFVIVAIGGGTMLVTGTSFGVSTIIMTLAVLAAIGLIYGISALVAGRGGRGAEYQYAARKFRWWWVPAALLGAFQVLLIARDLIVDPKKENVFALLIISAFSALVFGGMAVRSRVAGNWMIATGVLPMLPMFWWVAPPILSLLVIVMALSDNVRMGRPAPAV